jgi:hypothetical protein
MNAKSDVANASSIDLDDQMIAENGLHVVSIGDLLINGSCVALIAAQTRRIPAIFIRSHAAPRQFVAESSICFFFSNPYRRCTTQKEEVNADLLAFFKA